MLFLGHMKLDQPSHDSRQSLIIAIKRQSIWMQSKRMQNFQESSSVVTVSDKTVCYNGLENMKSAIQDPQRKVLSQCHFSLCDPCVLCPVALEDGTGARGILKVLPWPLKISFSTSPSLPGQMVKSMRNRPPGWKDTPVGEETDVNFSDYLFLFHFSSLCLTFYSIYS